MSGLYWEVGHVQGMDTVIVLGGIFDDAMRIPMNIGI